MAKRSKRHHYLPQFYLHGFTAGDGLLCLFDRETKEFRRQPPINTALQRDFYTVTDTQGVKTDRIEQLISGLESGARDVIHRLDEGMTGWKDREERASFALFLALFRTRTPAFDKEQMAFTEHLYRAMNRANHPSPELTAQGFKEFAEATGEDVSDIDPEQVFRMIRDNAYEVEVPRNYIIRLMMDSTVHMAEVLMTLDWTFVRAPHDLEFITSDAPFMTAPPPGETKCRVGGGRCWARYADTMNPRIVCTGCNNKMRTLADITTHDDVGEVFLCQVCGNQYGRESAGAALVLLPPKSTDLPSKA